MCECRVCLFFGKISMKFCAVNKKTAFFLLYVMCDTLSDILSRVIQECSFVHIFDIPYDVINYSSLNDICQFFDFVIYNISKLDHYVLQTFDDIFPHIKNKSLSRSDIIMSLSICKTLYMPKTTETENIYTGFYEKHKQLIDAIFSSCVDKEKCLFFIFSPVFPKEILALVSYKSDWIQMLKTRDNFSNFSELDLLIFLSGYVYLFKTQNPFADRLNENLDHKKLYFVFYA